MIRLFFVVTLLVFLFGCAIAPYRTQDIGTISVPGAYHAVKRGETLWSISKIYGADLKDVTRANRIPNASKIEVGQLIFIPDSAKKEESPNYAKTAKLESFSWPIRGTVVSYFGSTKSLAKNKGIDIQAAEGSKITASRSGKVTFASEHLKGYGKTIIIDHHDGFETVYAHNRDNLVSLNQHVKKGQVIARVGRTGRTTKPTLHFEVRKNHKPQNPFYYLP